MSEALQGATMLPDGTVVRGRGRHCGMPEGPRPDHGLYLGSPPDAPRRFAGRRRPVWRPEWPAEWIDWPDFRTPRDGDAVAAAIRRAYLLARAGQRVEVACGAGVGRTGTAIACMAVLAVDRPQLG